MKEIRIHCRGGQGGMTAARILANAALKEGKVAQAFPEFGPERRGAPVRSYIRIDDRYIWLRTPVEFPDVVMVFEETLLTDGHALSGIKPEGLLLINAPTPPSLAWPSPLRVAWVDASGIAQKFLGCPIPNTAMLGALCRVEELLSLDVVEGAVLEWFKDGHAEENAKALRASWEKVELIEREPSPEGAVTQRPRSRYAFLDEYPKVAIAQPVVGVAGRTGAWRVGQPVVEGAHCVRCGSCVTLCPDGVITMQEEGPVIDLDYCKGCGICVEECPVDAISFEEGG